MLVQTLMPLRVVHAILVLLLVAGTFAPATPAQCEASVPVVMDGAAGDLVLQPILNISGSCPSQPCYFLFNVEVNTGTVPGSMPPALPTPEPGIFMDLYVNSALALNDFQLTAPPPTEYYDWELVVDGVVNCGSTNRAYFFYHAPGGGQAMILGRLDWVCSGCPVGGN